MNWFSKKKVLSEEEKRTRLTMNMITLMTIKNRKSGTRSIPLSNNRALNWDGFHYTPVVIDNNKTISLDDYSFDDFVSIYKEVEQHIDSIL